MVKQRLTVLVTVSHKPQDKAGLFKPKFAFRFPFKRQLSANLVKDKNFVKNMGRHGKIAHICEVGGAYSPTYSF